MPKPAGTHIDDYIKDQAAAGDSGFAIAYAINRLAAAHERTARALDRLGFDAEGATTIDAKPGAIESLVLEVCRVANSLDQVAQAHDRMADRELDP